MASKRYNAAIWIAGILIAGTFAYYFITVILFVGARYSRPRIKLTKQEKEMIRVFESDCNCEVRLYHNYDLIKNLDGRRFYADDSVISISFRNDLNNLKYPIALCSNDDSFLIAHATQVATTMMKVISYKSYYQYIDIVYSSYKSRDIQSSTCNKVVEIKLTRQKNTESVRIK